MRDIVLLGSTGSIGNQTLEVIAGHPDAFRVVGLSAGGGNLDLLVDQANSWHPDVVAVPSLAAAAALGGGGGGRDDVAQGGGTNADALGAALDTVRDALAGA